MNVPFRWGYALLAGGAAAFAIVEGTDLAAAVPAATLAVVAAGLALWDTVRGRHVATIPTDALPPPPASAGSHVLLAQGTVGQESIVLLLDRIDRALAHPDFPVRSAADLAWLSTLPRVQFLEYLEHRIGELEAPA